MDTVYNAAKGAFAEALLDWEDDDIRSLLLVGSVTINPDHDTVADVLAANTEASDGSYSRVALSGKTVTVDDANNRASLDCSAIDYGSLNNETPTAILIFKHITNDAGSLPISIHDTNFGDAANGAGYEVTIPTDVIRIA